LLQKAPFFVRNWQKRCVYWLKSGGFSRFVFTDEYIWMVDNDVYYLLLALMNPSQKPGFKGGGWYRCCFSSPFDRFSFAPAPSSFSQLKTIVRLRRVIVCKLFSVGDKELARLGVRGFPCPQRRGSGGTFGGG
jgi:hypothetical protein